MKFYVATSIENANRQRQIRDVLTTLLDHKCTYDWSVHGAVWPQGRVVCQETAVAEVEGVKSADYLVVVLPGRRGTHVELGVALALEKPVFILGRIADFEIDSRTCVFHHHPLVQHVTSEEELVSRIQLLGE